MSDPERKIERPVSERPSTSPAARWASAGQPAEKSKDFGASSRRLARRLAPERALVATVLSCAVIGNTMSVFGPKILGRGTDIIFKGLFSGKGIDRPSIHRVLFLALGLYLGSVLMQVTQSFLLAGIVQRTMFRLRDEVEKKLTRLPLKYIDGQPRGDLLSRVTNDIDNIAQSLQQTLSQMLSSILALIGVVIMMLWISPLLAIVAVITVPLSTYVVKRIAAHSKTRFMAQWRHTGSLNALVEETFTGHAIVKVFGRQHEVEERFRAKNDELYEASFGAQFLSGTIQPAMSWLGNLNFVAIAVIGGFRVAAKQMTLGSVQAFIQYSRQFSQPLAQMASMINTLQSGVASAERVFELLDAPEQSPDPAPSKRTAAASALSAKRAGLVAFEHVYFSYDKTRPLIEDLSLVAEPGRTVAIVGPTGAGKTTLVNLIMRFYELDAGRITLDGQDISMMPRSELRGEVGMVLQDTWLFGGTIRENIAYGNPVATEEQIRAAAKATYVDRFVRALPKGYDTILTDDATSVSAGEKQLLTIARAFLSDPTILILDEATSSVDTRTEVLIQRAMAALRQDRTSFVIAHRLSTIRDADTILVMESGRIVEQGNHDELLAVDGAYARLYNSQFTGAATADS